MSKWLSVHNCRWDASCLAKESVTPNRLYVHTHWGSLIVALDRDSATQAWLPFKGYIDAWWPVVWHPR